MQGHWIPAKERKQAGSLFLPDHGPTKIFPRCPDGVRVNVQPLSAWAVSVRLAIAFAMGRLLRSGSITSAITLRLLRGLTHLWRLLHLAWLFLTRGRSLRRLLHRPRLRVILGLLLPRFRYLAL